MDPDRTRTLLLAALLAAVAALTLALAAWTLSRPLRFEVRIVPASGGGGQPSQSYPTDW